MLNSKSTCSIGMSSHSTGDATGDSTTFAGISILDPRVLSSIHPAAALDPASYSFRCGSRLAPKPNAALALPKGSKIDNQPALV